MIGEASIHLCDLCDLCDLCFLRDLCANPLFHAEGAKDAVTAEGLC